MRRAAGEAPQDRFGRGGADHGNRRLSFDRRSTAIRVKDGHFARKYRRVKARSGHKVAIGAIKHAILIAIYHMLKTGELYRPPTPNPEAERKQHERTTKRLIAQLEKLGHSVTLQTSTAETVVAT